MQHTDRPGRELPKDIRRIALDLVDNQGWTYRLGKGHPMLYPADKTQPPMAVPTTPSEARGYRNWISAVRQRGGKV